MFDRSFETQAVVVPPAITGGVTVSTCLVNVEQRAEVLDPRKTSGKLSIANDNLALAA